jgi:hypothetical protein
MVSQNTVHPYAKGTMKLKKLALGCWKVKEKSGRKLNWPKRKDKN